MIFVNAIWLLATVMIQTGNQPRLQESGKVLSRQDEKIIFGDSFTLDLSRSKVIWSGKALGFHNHKGTVYFTKASLKISHGKISGGIFVIDLNSITPTDRKLQPDERSGKEKLKRHLLSEEFFDAENYPIASFILDTISVNDASGILTVHGNSSRENVENIAVSKSGETIEIKGDMIFNRRKYGVAWNSKFKDRILSENILVEVILVGN